jgi:hypothetical protein
MASRVPAAYHALSRLRPFLRAQYMQSVGKGRTGELGLASTSGECIDFI